MRVIPVLGSIRSTTHPNSFNAFTSDENTNPPLDMRRKARVSGVSGGSSAHKAISHPTNPTRTKSSPFRFPAGTGRVSRHLQVSHLPHRSSRYHVLLPANAPSHHRRRLDSDRVVVGVGRWEWPSATSTHPMRRNLPGLEFLDQLRLGHTIRHNRSRVVKRVRRQRTIALDRVKRPVVIRADKIPGTAHQAPLASKSIRP